MKLSNLPQVLGVAEARSRAERELDTILGAERDGELLAEVSFFAWGSTRSVDYKVLSEAGDPRHRVFSSDGKSTRLPLDEAAYRELSNELMSMLKSYLRNEIDRCDSRLRELGVKPDAKVSNG